MYFELLCCADAAHPLIHDTASYGGVHWQEHKLRLDEKLKQQVRSTHAAVLYNLELMPANTATLLHGYCDNDNAPIKRVSADYDAGQTDEVVRDMNVRALRRDLEFVETLAR